MENQIVHKRSRTFYLCYLLQYSILSSLKLLKIIIVFFLTIGIETLTSPFFQLYPDPLIVRLFLKSPFSENLPDPPIKRVSHEIIPVLQLHLILNSVTV